MPYALRQILTSAIWCASRAVVFLPIQLKQSKNMYLKSIATLFLSVTFGFATFAQTPNAMPQQQQQIEVSDEQLKTFKEVSDKLQVKQQAVQKEIESAVQDAGLEMAQFQKMASQQMRGNSVDSMDAYTDEEKANFKEAMTVAQQKQQGMMQQVSKMVQDAGMDMQTFQQIATQIRSDKALQQRFQKLQGGQGQSPQAP